MKLKWNVYHINAQNEIIEINIFDHKRFYHGVEECLKTCRDRNEFATELRRELFYYFCSKYEYEIGLTEAFPHIAREEVDKLADSDFKIHTFVNLKTHRKIDVYQQIMMNYSIFVDYIWNNRKEIEA